MARKSDPKAVTRSRMAPKPRAASANRFPSGFVDKRSPWMALPPNPQMPAAFDLADVTAFQALLVGTANEHQQKRIKDWLIYASNMGGDPFVPGAPDATAYGCGKRHLGLQIKHLMTVNPAIYKDQTVAA